MWYYIAKLAAPDLNVRVHNESDFYSFCEREGIKVIHEDTGEPGMYCVYEGTPVIFLHPGLRGGDRLWVQYHELAHHWLHVPGTQFFLGNDRKLDAQADYLASILLIPAPLVRTKTAGEIQEEFGYPAELIRIRFQAYRRLKI